MAKYSNKDEEIKRRCEQYDCDGICYSRDKMCNRVDICPETRSKEFAATVAAVILITSFYLAIIIMVVSLLINLGAGN